MLYVVVLLQDGQNNMDLRDIPQRETQFMGGFKS